ncbi:MAG: hypothetical protein P1V51_06560 [Deltaproteobacteria bacterium]|nr:hypothetical protein [Deltaproteobacteria bacterium]
MTRARTRVWGALVLLAAVASPARADTFLNGVNITGVTGQTFEKATVRIDANGNVHIDAPGYAVAGAKAGAAPADGGATATAPVTTSRAMSGRYYLVSSQNEVGATSYDIDLYINAKWIRKLRGEESQVVADVTRFLRPGQNKILIMAKKNLAKGLKSRSPGHTFRVVLGEGAEGGNNVMIERTLVDFSVNAAQMEDISREYTVTVN